MKCMNLLIVVEVVVPNHRRICMPCMTFSNSPWSLKEKKELETVSNNKKRVFKWVYLACCRVHSLAVERERGSRGGEWNDHHIPTISPITHSTLSLSSLPVAIAAFSFSFQCWATSFASGSSGLGADNRAWIESKTVLICNAGDHLSENKNRVEGGEGVVWAIEGNCIE